MLKSLAKLNAFELHRLVMHRLQERDKPVSKTDLDIIRENHRFLWQDDIEPQEWEQRLAKKYYSKLFREYTLCDLSRYKDNQIALRWRIEAEVVSGKGQFICGNKRCAETNELRSWEVNFSYKEDGSTKSTLVKLRLCVSCSKKLNYHSTKRLVKKQKKRRADPELRQKPNCDSVRKEPRGEIEEAKSQLPIDNKSEPSTSTETSGTSKWTEDVAAVAEEKSREDVFGDYLEDLLL